MVLNYLQHICRWPVICRNQWKTPGELVAMQERSLRRLISHAYSRVPYYRRLLDSAGIHPGEIRTLEDLRRIPVLTRDMVAANYPDGILMSGVDWGDCSPRMTSGSSGRKLEVVLDHGEAVLYRLMQLRQLLDIGYRPWYNMAYVRYSPPATNIVPQRIGLFRRSYIPLEWGPERQASEIVRIRPQVLNAYPSVLYLLARTLGKDGGASLGLKFLMSNSELLTVHVRRYLEDVFQCRVYDDYSCLEFSAIGFECRMQNLHVASDNVILEVLNERGNRVPPGERGRIVLTSLNNYSMPYIRYEIGDVGILAQEQCPCGRHFPVLKAIIGRCDDFVVMPSGKLVDPQTVVFQIETIPEVREFRVIQKEDRSLIVDIVPEGEIEFTAVREKVGQKLNTLFNGALPVDVVEARALDRGSTGKHRSVISRTSGGHEASRGCQYRRGITSTMSSSPPAPATD